MDIIKGSLVIFTFKGIGAGLMLLSNIFVSNIYGAEYLGVMNLLMIALDFGVMFSLMGIDVYFLKIIPGLSDTRDIGGFIRKAIFRLFIISLIVSLTLYLFIDQINKHIFPNFELSNALFWLAILIFPFAIFRLMPEILRALDSIFSFSLFKNLLFQISLFGAIGLFYLLSLNSFFFIHFAILAVAIVAIFYLFFFLKKRDIFLHKNYNNYKEPILRVSYNMFLTSSILVLLANIDKFMISYFIDEKQVGYYAACIKLSILVTFVLSSVTSFVTPKVAKAYQSNNREEIIHQYKRATRTIISFSLPIILPLALFPSFFLGLFGSEFQMLTNTLYIVLIMNIANIFFGPLLYILNMINEHKFVRNIIGISFLLNMILNYFLIPEYGINGAAIATLISTVFWKLNLFIRLKQRLLSPVL